MKSSTAIFSNKYYLALWGFRPTYINITLAINTGGYSADMTSNIVFFAEATKGYIIKVIVDTLCGGGIGRGIFVIDKTGIKLRQTDQGSTILYDINLGRENFRGYKCSKPITISVNLKHMQGLLKNIKKKDSVSIHIDSTQPGKFFITIRPEGARENTRFETNSIAYMSEKNYTMDSLPDCYDYPMVISASDFQKIKRLTSIGKTITIKMQNSNYLSFRCDAGAVMDAELGFGKLSDDPEVGRGDEDSVCGGCGEDINECWCECDECGEYKSECWCECSECGEYKSECVCNSRVDKIYEGEYHSAILNKLVKLPGMCTQMQFYAPTVKGYPLKIEINTGQGGYTLGKVQVYIKDVVQLNYEATLNSEDVDVIQVAPVKKAGKK